MSGHLCLKWNNHSSAFLKSLCNIQIKERYCDATIACQGKYFPVHRIILSTCSDYFEEMFERMQCQHPYIVFKDIEPKEMELLLDYMYQGEVNVVQEMLPTLIKAAEALRVKGLAVPDEMPSGKDYSTGRKRSNSSNDSPQAKRKSEEVKRRTQGLSDPIRTEETEGAVSSNIEESNSGNDPTSFSLYETNSEANSVMKQEPEDPLDYSHDSLPALSAMPTASESQFRAKIEAIYNSSDTYIKPEDNVPENESSAEPQVPSPWTIFSAMSSAVNHDSSNPDNMLGVNTGLEALSTRRKELCPRRPPDRAEYNAQSRQKRPEFVAQEEESDEFCVQGAKPFEYLTHGPDSSIRKCQHCAYETDDKYRLERHILFKHQGLRPFPCPICPLRCALRTDLERHMLIHTGEKPFQCPHCEFKFRRKAHLNVHMARQNCGAKK